MPGKIAAIIVDDETPARMRLREFLQREPDIDIVAECSSAAQAVAAIAAMRPQLLFLDVQMPGGDGFEVLGGLQPDEIPGAIVMVTAHDEYALRAFDASAVDYLLKPYTEERFRTALGRAREKIAASRPDANVERLLEAMHARQEQQRLALRTRGGVQFIDGREIDWLQADGNYAVLHIGRHELRIREKIADLEQRLGSAFLRVHRSIMVNRDRIVRIEPWSTGEYLLVLRDGTKIQSGRTYATEVRELMT